MIPIQPNTVAQPRNPCVAAAVVYRPAMLKSLLAVLALMAANVPALATGKLAEVISAEDRARLDGFAAIKEEALAEAAAGGGKADLAVLEEALAGESLPTATFDAKGDYRCRTIKVGGLLPLVVYPWFKCRISDDGAGFVLEKLSGSQRTTGRLYDDAANRMIYLGAGHVNDDPPRNYNDDPEQNQVAYVTRNRKTRLVFQFPSPKFESKLDILVLERR
jgi:Domain of unknown function (DUF4893)